MSRNNFTVSQMKAMRKRSNDVCEAGKSGTYKMYGMADADLCHRPAKEFDHIVADKLKGTKIKSIDEGLHVCLTHHVVKTQGHDMPKIRKVNRIKAKAAGVRRQTRPIPGSKASGLKKSFNGEVTHRD